MDHEIWSELVAAMFDVARSRCSGARFTHDVVRIVRVHLWSVLHDRSTNWACQACNWPRHMRPRSLPSQSTMSRRLRKAEFHDFMEAVGRRLAGRPSCAMILTKIIDGKPMAVAAHSTDPQARWGRGAGQMQHGYKLHAIMADSPMPVAWRIEPLDVAESVAAHILLRQLSGGGYLLADASYDASELHDLAHACGHQLLAPRRKPDTGLGHCYQSPHRLRAIDLLEGPGVFGPQLHLNRYKIERDFAHLTSFGGGLTTLPPWVRRLHRVQAWVHAKLLINAARIRIVRKKAVG